MYGMRCQAGMASGLLRVYRSDLNSQFKGVLDRLASADLAAGNGTAYLYLYGGSARHGQPTSQAHAARGHIENTRLKDGSRS